MSRNSYPYNGAGPTAGSELSEYGQSEEPKTAYRQPLSVREPANHSAFTRQAESGQRTALLEHLVTPGRTDGSEHALQPVDVFAWTANTVGGRICTGIAAAEIQRTESVHIQVERGR